MPNARPKAPAPPENQNTPKIFTGHSGTDFLDKTNFLKAMPTVSHLSDPSVRFVSGFVVALRSRTSNSKRMADEKLVISTAGSKEEASRIAHALVEERLAACVNIVGPIESVYRWQDKVESAPEFLILAKTAAAKSAALIGRIRELHSYDLPEAIEVSIDGGSREYLKWIAESV